MQPLRRDMPKHDYRAELFELIRTRSFGRGKIMLASGRESDFYFDLRPTTIHPAGATAVGELVADALEGTDAEFVGGLEAGAIPIATATAIASHRRGGKLQAFFVRKKPKDHGAKKLIEGLPKGETLKGRCRLCRRCARRAPISCWCSPSWTGSKARRRLSRRRACRSGRFIRRVSFWISVSLSHSAVEPLVSRNSIELHLPTCQNQTSNLVSKLN